MRKVVCKRHHAEVCTDKGFAILGLGYDMYIQYSIETRLVFGHLTVSHQIVPGVVAVPNALGASRRSQYLFSCCLERDKTSRRLWSFTAATDWHTNVFLLTKFRRFQLLSQAFLAFQHLVGNPLLLLRVALELFIEGEHALVSFAIL